MSNEKITVERALELLDKAVEQKGADYVYEPPDVARGECVYAARDENGEVVPSCIVGHVLAYEKPEIFRKLARAEVEDGTSYQITNSEIADLILPEIEMDAITVLRRAQIMQDNDRPWGEALKGAKAEAAELARVRARQEEGDRA